MTSHMLSGLFKIWYHFHNIIWEELNKGAVELSFKRCRILDNLNLVIKICRRQYMRPPCKGPALQLKVLCVTVGLANECCSVGFLI